jgi:rhodanese-related sulfurtransferase
VPAERTLPAVQAVLDHRAGYGRRDRRQRSDDVAIKRAWDLVDEAKQRIENLTLDQAMAEWQDGSATLVDIRDIRERLLKGAIPGSIHAPRGMLEFWIDPSNEYYRKEFDPEKRYVLYCAAGGRSALAADTMRRMGYENVAHIEAGFDGWAAAHAAVEDVSESSKWVRRDSE